jgi:glycosyltransferase involved in cell wall biosynthesis
MSSAFASDPHPGRPRILFVGFGEGTHTHSWIDLLEGSPFNVRLFALPTLTLPPDDWAVRTYVSGVPSRRLDRARRRSLHPPGRLGWAVRHLRAAVQGGGEAVVERWLARVLREWRPDIVHTLGLDPAGLLFLRTRQQHDIGCAPRWVLQLRGGSDLTLSRHDPVLRPSIQAALVDCDQLVSDNLVNFEWAREMGVRDEQLAAIAPVPGTGGIDVASIASIAALPPAQRRTIVLPKGYDTRWSKATPIFEALRMTWERIAPCRVHLLAASSEIRAWALSLPGEIRAAMTIEDRIPRRRALELIATARVMVAPSLIDGIPNTMYEAMAGGALPVLSPLDTIRPLVEDGRNVLFARNLYPDEIAAAVLRAMSDDELVERAARENLVLVRRLADRLQIRPQVIGFYESLASRRG